MSREPFTEVDGEQSQNLNLLSQDTLRDLMASFDNPEGEAYKTIVNRGSFSFVTSSSDSQSTKCEVCIDTYIPNTTNTQFATYSGQVPEYPQDMTYSDISTPIPPPPSTSPGPMAFLPTTQPYRGVFNFRLEFGKQPKDTKSTAWTYSSVVNKLYAQKDAMCPIKFAIDGDGVANGLFIRALPVFSRPEHIQDVVKRCPNHIQAPESANIPHREHFIWCENQSARYMQDPSTSRYAVVVPYDTPAPGTPFVTYLFSFKCLNSCVGGPNRREMSIVFTLEDGGGRVHGRQYIDLRICACPGRDRKTDENKLDPNKKTTSPNQKTANTGMTALQTPANIQPQSIVHHNQTIALGRPPSSGNGEVYTLTVKGRKNFEILTSIRDSLEMCEMVPTQDRELFTQQRRQKDIQYSGQQQRLPQMSRAFNFTSSSKPFCVKQQDVVHSTQRGSDMTDGAATPPSPPPPPLQSSDSPNGGLSVAQWLGQLGLGAYEDNFHTSGLYSMDQLKSERNFTFSDLMNMGLTKATVSTIWNKLKTYRATINPTVVSLKSDSVVLPDSQGSATLSLPPQQSSSRLFGSGLQFTKCSVKITVQKRNNTSDKDNTDDIKRVKLEENLN